MPNLIPLGTPGETPPVLADRDFFTKAQVWPLHGRIDPREWLSNFEADELPYAHDLLGAFVYFNEALTTELFRSAVQRLGAHVLDFNKPPDVVQSDWRRFVGNVIVTAVRGEEPNPSDSGYAYVRMSRDLGFEERQFMEAEGALRAMLAPAAHPGERRAVVFVDDFVGSGNQFVDTWERKLEVYRGYHLSFQRLAAATSRVATPHPLFFYCPLICTEVGAARIRGTCPEVTLSPAHIIPPEYSALHPGSRIWDPSRASTAEAILHRIALRTGMHDTGGASVDDWRGFHSLGIALAIRDSIPDANLGVFRWDRNGWIPLFKKPA